MGSSQSPSTDGVPDRDDSPSRREHVVDQFVTFWGDMASSWGINRTMARVHALLYCAERPLNTDEVMERLQISRGSASMNLRALVDWKLVEKTSVPGSRKDHYEAEQDVWRITARIIEERERREVRPVQKHLESCAETLVPEGTSLSDCPEEDQALYRRLQNLTELMEVAQRLSSAVLPLVKNREADLLKQLVSLAQSLRAASDPVEEEPST